MFFRATATATAGYFYLANSPLVGQIGFTNNGAWRMTTTKAYDSLNRLTEISCAPSGSGLCFGKPQRGEMCVAPGPPHPLPFCFSAARRHPRTEGARAFLPARRETARAAPPKNWGMNGGAVAFYQHAAPLGLGVGCNRPVAKRFQSGMWGGFQRDWQVISGKKYWSDGTPVAGQQFEYSFDDIGNRTGTKAGGDENGVGLRAAAYSANDLNQYTSRDVPGAVDAMGIAFATNTVTANGQGVYRKGEYFRKELTVNNASAPVWTNITVNATGQASVSGNALLPKAQEQFWYDADGNLTSDSLWTNHWNAENRLVLTESGTGVPPVARLREAWTYLPDGRWIERIVSTNDGSSYYPAGTNRYVWDGQVLLAMLDHTNGVVMSFVRGLDLSGTIQGAGGVGGVLAVAFKTNGTHFVCCDGNGNVAALTDASSGANSAVFEYGPFGEPLRVTGLAAVAMPLRFSTMYEDEVTGDRKYLFREYRPSLGRWPNRDPLGEPGCELLRGRRGKLRGDEPNLYAFVRNNPVGRIDFLGLLGNPNPKPDPCPCGEAAAQIAAVGPIDANTARRLANEALAAARASGLPGLRNGPADAFRHCFWSCRMAQEIGAGQAKEVGDTHERCNKNPAGEESMDQANNATGRGFGTPGANCHDLCLQAARNGTLQTSPGGTPPANPY
jgi:RHS repeat-associated protein